MITLGLDYGEKRIGVAASDELGIVALGLPVIERDGREVERIVAVVEERGAERIVVGMPFRMNGTEGRQARRVRGFIKKLKRRLPAVPVQTMDERLTSAQAHRALTLMGAGMRTRRQSVDRMAAQIILQRFLDRQRQPADGQDMPEGPD